MEMLREFFVLIGLNVDESAFSEAEKSIGRIRTTLLGVTAAAAGMSAVIVAATRDFVTQTEEIDAWSVKLGEGTETLSGLKTLFESTGVEAERGFETISDAAERVGDVVKNVKKLSGDAGEALGRIGFKNINELKDANGDVLRSLPLFKLLASRLADVENEGQRTGIAMQLFGDAGRDVIPFITRYGKDMDAAIESSMRFGAVVGKEDVQAARDFRAAYGGVIATIRGVSFIIGRRTLPVVSKYLRQLSDWVIGHKELIAIKVESAMTKIGNATAFAWEKAKQYFEVAEGLVKTLGGLTNTVVILGGILAGVFLAQVGAATTALYAMGVAAGVTKVAMLKGAAMAGVYGLAIAGLLLILDDAITAAQGGDSAVGRFIDRFDSRNFDPNEWAPIKAIRLFVAYIGEAAASVRALYNVMFGDDQEKAFAQDYLNKVGGRILKIQSSLAKDIAGAVTLNPDGYAAKGIQEFLSGGTGDFYAGLKNGVVGFVEDAQRFDPSKTPFIQGVNQRLQGVSDGFVGRYAPAAVTTTTTTNAPNITINGSGLSKDELISATETALARTLTAEAP